MRRVRESCPSRGAPGECEPTTACQILQRLTCRSLRHNVEYLASPSNVEGQLSGAQPGLCTRIVSNTAPAKAVGTMHNVANMNTVVPGHNRCWPFCRGLCRPLVLHATFLILRVLLYGQVRRVRPLETEAVTDRSIYFWAVTAVTEHHKQTYQAEARVRASSTRTRIHRSDRFVMVSRCTYIHGGPKAVSRIDRFFRSHRPMTAVSGNALFA